MEKAIISILLLALGGCQLGSTNPLLDYSDVQLDVCEVGSYVTQFDNRRFTVTGRVTVDIPYIFSDECPSDGLPIISGEPSTGYDAFTRALAHSEDGSVEAEFYGQFIENDHGGIEFDVLRIENPRLTSKTVH